MKNVYTVYYKSNEGDNMVGSAYGDNEAEALKDFAEKMYICNAGAYEVKGIEFYKRIAF
jgi:hypothetical protein